MISPWGPGRPAGAAPPPGGLVVDEIGSNTVTSVAVPANTFTSATSGITNPTFVAVTPDGRTAYVVNQSSNTVTPVDLSVTPNVAGTPIPVGQLPFGIAITPDGRTAYVGNFIGNSVTPIDLSTNTAESPIALPGVFPFDIAIAPDGKTAYVANTVSNQVIPIDLTTTPPTVGSPITVGTGPEGLAITPDGRFLYVANVDDNDASVVDLTTNPPAVATIPTGVGAQDVTISPDGKTAYVLNGNAGTQTLPGSVSVIDVATESVTATITVQIGPGMIKTSTDGGIVYVTGTSDNTIDEIDAATDQVSATISDPALNVPDGIAVIPDQAPTTSFTVTPADARTATTFDGSASSARTGSVALYEWDFGDGSTATTTSPTTTHVYATQGDYTATLTVVDSGGTSTTVTFTGQTVSNKGGPSARTNRTFHVPPAPPTTTTTTTTPGPTTTTTTTPPPTTTTQPGSTTTLSTTTTTTGSGGAVAVGASGSGAGGSSGADPVSVRAGAARAKPANELGFVVGSGAVAGAAGTPAVAFWRRRRRPRPRGVPRDG